MNNIEHHYAHLANTQSLPAQHIAYLESLKKSGFEPKVIYDIGSCVLHWTKEAQRLWPNAQIILFDANPHCEFLYKDYQYYIGLLSSVSNANAKFYLNEYSPGGASYYREIGSKEAYLLYPPNKYFVMNTMTLDDVVRLKKFPPPDLVKMDVQGAERDIFQGGMETIKHASHLILELPKPNIQYNENAPSAKETLELVTGMGWKCTAPLFSDNGEFDGDYGFEKNVM